MRKANTSLLFVLVLLTGCTHIAPDRGYEAVLADVKTRTQLPPIEAPPPDPELRSSVLTMDDAVRLMLVHNPQMRAVYARLGIGEADRFDLARPANPVLVGSVRGSNERGSADLISFGLTQQLLDLALQPARARIADTIVEELRLLMANDVFNLILDTRAAYLDFQRATLQRRLHVHTTELATINELLTERYFAAGNINQLALDASRAAATQRRVQLAAAIADVDIAKAKLIQLMSHIPTGDWRIVETLQLPDSLAFDAGELKQSAVARRADLLAAAVNVERQHQSLNLTTGTRYLGEVAFSAEYERETDRSRLLGPGFSLTLPLFNQGQGRVLRARSTLELGQANYDELAIKIGYEVAAASQLLAAQFQQLQHYRNELIPARAAIANRTRAFESYMLASPFELLEAKQAEFQAYSDYVNIVGTFWLNHIELCRAVAMDLPVDLGGYLDISAVTEQHAAAARHPNHDHHENQL